MSVLVPRPQGNGTINTTSVVTVNSSYWIYPTIEQAIAAVGNKSYNYTNQKTHAYRANCQSGVTPSGLRDTNYKCTYRRSEPFGDLIVVDRYPGVGYIARKCNGAGYGYTGGFGTGVGTPGQVYDPGNVSAVWQDIANRQLSINLKNRVEAEALLKARQSVFDAAESLADIDKSLGMVASRVRDVLSAFAHAKKRNWRKAANALGVGKRGSSAKKDLANGWLELQYGWKPLLNDIYDLIGLINGKLEALAEEGEMFTVTRRGTVSLYLPDSSSFYSGDGWELEGSGRHWVETKYRFVINDAQLSNMTSLGLENPLLMAWNRLPYSFVVDWLMPVSSWLNAMTGDLGLEFHSGYTSAKTDASWRATNYGSNSAAYRSGSFGHQNEWLQLERKSHLGFPITQIWFRNPFSSKQRAVNAAALIAQSKRA